MERKTAGMPRRFPDTPNRHHFFAKRRRHRKALKPPNFRKAGVKSSTLFSGSRSTRTSSASCRIRRRSAGRPGIPPDRARSPPPCTTALTPSLQASISRFGADARAKLVERRRLRRARGPARAPLETLIADLAELCGFRREALAAVGESSLAALKTRPDYAVTVRNALVGFIEVKAPGKGADPRQVPRPPRQGAVGEAASRCPNLLYTDGNGSASGATANSTAAIVRSKATSRPPAPSLAPRSRCSGCSTTSSAGSRSPPTQRARSWPRSAPGSAACCATR